MKTIIKWIILLLLITCLFLTNTLLKYKHQLEFLENKVETVDSLSAEYLILTQECEYDIRQCQESYDNLLSEHNLILDSLFKCREKTLKFNPKVQNNGKSIQSKVSYNGSNERRN